MLDLKKRNSFTLTCSRETEEFRRVAVRRKVKSTARIDCCASQTGMDEQVSDSCSSAHASNGIFVSNFQLEGKRSPAKGSPFKPPIPPKPVHVEILLRQTQCQSRTTGIKVSQVIFTEQDQSPNSDQGQYVFCTSAVQGSLSPIRLNGEIPNFTRSPITGSSCPGKRGFQSCSPLKEGRQDPATDKHLLTKDVISPQNEGHVIKEMVEGKDCTEVNRINDGLEGDKISVEDSSIFPCQSNEATTEDDGIHKEPEGEQNDEADRKERGADKPKDEEITKQRLYNIANEILQTERAYVARLHLLDQVLCSRLMKEAGQGSFPPEVIKTIFSNISAIYSFHSQFLLPDLENCISHWSESPSLGNVLLQHAPFLRMYSIYVENFEQARELLSTWTERSSAFRSIIQEIQKLDECGNLTLHHHMLEPVQRLPRYELLLRDYLKTLPEDAPDYDLIHRSLQTISMAATHTDHAIHRAESLKRLVEIYEMVGEEEVINPTNEFLKEGRLNKLAARNTNVMERHLFLFNNFLLCCTPKFSLIGPRFTVRCRIGVNGMHVQQTTNENHPYSFQVSGKEKTLELQANSEQDMDEWIKVIQEAIDEFQKKNETFKQALKEQDMDEATKELGRRAPRWIRDHESNTCMKCQESFNLFTRRRHHCRACGCVVCGRCSDYKVALEYDDNKLNKVCKDCYSILTGQKGEWSEGENRQMLESSDSLMSSFLLYSEDSENWQPVWCVLTTTESLTLCLYTSPQDVKPFSCIPVLSCNVEDSPQLNGLPCFCLSQSKTTHTFSCDGSNLKQNWLAVLRAAAGSVAEGILDDCDTSSDDSVCGINGNTNAGE